MGTTDNYAIPWPECDPPLRKDASDIADYRDLAEAADAAFDVVYDQASDQVFNVDAARMGMSAPVTTTGQNVYPFFNTSIVDIGDNLTDVQNGVIQIREPGRYWCGTHANLVSATAMTGRTRLLINGSPVTNFQSPSIIVTPSNAHCLMNVVISFTTPSTLSSQIRHSASTALSFDYRASIWAFQIEKF